MKFVGHTHVSALHRSHPSRGAWIEIGVIVRAESAPSRTPHGVRGLKFCLLLGVVIVPQGRTPHGVRGLKYARC